MANMKCPICKGKGKILEDALQYEFVTRDAINSTCLYCMGFGVISPNKKLPDGRKAHEIKIDSPDPAPTPGPSPKTRLNVSKKAAINPEAVDTGVGYQGAAQAEQEIVNREQRGPYDEPMFLEMAMTPRLQKVLASGKEFLVVTETDQYYMDVYMLIRAGERKKGTWSAEDEERYVSALEEQYLAMKEAHNG
ncbi:MAG: hypothetical protein WCR34_03315 [Bacilli bacterium]